MPIAYTPENIPLSSYEGNYEMFTVVATGKAYKDAGWLTEVFFLGSRTTRGARVAPSPRWEHVSRVKPHPGINVENIRSVYRDDLQVICEILNTRGE